MERNAPGSICAFLTVQIRCYYSKEFEEGGIIVTTDLSLMSLKYRAIQKKSALRIGGISYKSSHTMIQIVFLKWNGIRENIT